LPALREKSGDQLDGQREDAEKREDGGQSDQTGGKHGCGFQNEVLFIALWSLKKKRIES
jgi:hypothetical protein